MADNTQREKVFGFNGLLCIRMDEVKVENKIYLKRTEMIYWNNEKTTLLYTGCDFLARRTFYRGFLYNWEKKLVIFFADFKTY